MTKSMNRAVKVAAYKLPTEELSTIEEMFPLARLERRLYEYEKMYHEAEGFGKESVDRLAEALKSYGISKREIQRAIASASSPRYVEKSIKLRMNILKAVREETRNRPIDSKEQETTRRPDLRRVPQDVLQEVEQHWEQAIGPYLSQADREYLRIS